MDWRTWAYQTLTEDPRWVIDGNAIATFGAGSLTSTPDDKPFVVLRFGVTIEAAVPGTDYTDLQVWAHDDPGTYMRIGTILALAKSILVGQVAEVGAIACRWQGDSGDLADDGLGTITRNSSFRLVGKD